LLCAAHAQLPEPLAGPGLRDPAHRQAQHRGGAAAELGKRSYVPKLIAIGTATDCYQPVERELRLTRVIELMQEWGIRLRWSPSPAASSATST
jgi:hypothetical protein